jgi:HK97 gp10 family phage protein
MSEIKHVQGLAEIQRKLAEFPAKVEANVVRAALRAGAVVVQREALALVPVKTGQLKSTVRVSTFKRGREIHAAVKAGDPKKRVFYAHLVEGGTKAHVIKARKGGLLLLGKRFFAKSVQHPGAKPSPFMRPAFNGTADRALAAIADRARARLEKLKP